MNGRTNSNNSSTMTILGDGIPLDPPSSFLCEARNSKVDITWVDPKDKYATPEGEQMEDTDQLVSVWAYTKIVRKEGSQPTSPSDGVTVCTITTRNQYQSTIFEDTGVTNGVTYYYAAYAYNTAGTYSDGAFSDGITPIEWDPVLANNSWEQIDSACTQGVAQSIWNVGDEKSTKVNNETQTVVILGFNMDYLSDKSGKAVITFGSKNLLANTYQWSNRTWRYMDETYQELYMSMPSDIKPFVRQVRVFALDISLAARYASLDEQDGYLFAYTRKRVDGAIIEYIDKATSNGIKYSNLKQYPYYGTLSNRIKRLKNGSGKANPYGIYDYAERISGGTTYLSYPGFDANGEYTEYLPNTGTTDATAGLAFAFCIGKTSI